jgi:hypothetical protein
MTQHPLHRLHRHQPIAVLVHQTEAALHIGAHLVPRDSAVAIGIRRPGTVVGTIGRLRQKRRGSEQRDSE